MDLCVAAYACISNFEIKKNKDKKYSVKVLKTLTTYRPIVTIFCNIGLNNNILIKKFRILQKKLQESGIL